MISSSTRYLHDTHAQRHYDIQFKMAILRGLHFEGCLTLHLSPSLLTGGTTVSTCHQDSEGGLSWVRLSSRERGFRLHVASVYRASGAAIYTTIALVAGSA